MLNQGKVLKELVLKLKKIFKDFPVESSEVKEGYKRQSFSIRIPYSKASDYMKKYRETTLYAQLYYFSSKNGGYNELYKIKSELERTFYEGCILEVEGIPVEIKNIFSKVLSQETLFFKFNVYIFEEYNPKEIEKIETLNIKI